MKKKMFWVVLVSVAVFTAGSCDSGTKQANANKGNTNAAAKPEKEMTASMQELEASAYSAWKKKDGKFFEGFLTDGFIGNGPNGRNVKANVVKSIADNPCEIKGYSISGANAVELAKDTVLFTASTTSDMTCDGKAAPSPMFASTVYVKDGDDWKAAYHQNAPTPDTKGEAPAPPADAEAPKLPDDADKELTAKFTEQEKVLWEAWNKKDTKPFETALADNFSEFNMKGYANREAALKEIAEHDCEMKSHSLSDFLGTKLADNVYLYTYKATVDGTCGDRPMPKAMWVTTIITKDGDSMKGNFHMATPAAG